MSSERVRARNTKLLIEAVKEYPYLYDVNHELYRDSGKKLEAWDNIASKLNINRNSAKQRWKTLRDGYVRFKKNQMGQINKHNKKYSSWPWRNHLQFLGGIQSYLDNNKKLYAASERGKNEDTIFEQEPDTSESISESSNVLQNSNTNLTINSSPNTSNMYLQADRKLDGIDHLFMNYAYAFRKLLPATQAKLKLDLATLFAEAEIRDLGMDPHDLIATKEKDN